MIWIVAGVSVIVIAIVVVAVRAARRRRRAAEAVAPARSVPLGERIPEVHALDDALRTVESLTDANGSLLIDQVGRDGQTIRDRLASGEAHLESLRQPDANGPLLGRVLDEVAPPNPGTPRTPGP